MERRLRCIFGALSLSPSLVCSNDCTTVSVPALKSTFAPPQAKDFPAAKSCRDSQEHGRVETIAFQQTKELDGLALIQRPHLFAFGSRRLHRVNGIPRQQLSLDRLRESRVKHAVEMHDALRREPSPAVPAAAR